MLIMKKSLLLLSIFVSLISCQETSSENENINKGNVIVAADESLKPLVEAQINAYKAHYPETTFTTLYLPEQKAINLLLKDSAEVAIVTRELSENEQIYFKSKQIPYQPAKFAIDGVSFIVNNNSPISELSLDDIKEKFSESNKTTQMVFDNSSSSNLYYLINKFKIKDPQKLNITTADGTINVFDFISKSNTAIGIVGNNWISDDDSKMAKELRKKVKILPIKIKSTDLAYLPSFENIKAKKYPLDRMVYMHTTKIEWKVAKGFIRFSCSQIGQLIAEKMGILPYYNIPKDVILDKKSK